jgi:hypothetical protein
MGLNLDASWAQEKTRENQIKLEQKESSKFE